MPPGGRITYDGAETDVFAAYAIGVAVDTLVPQ
jgi:hypothetical protein